MITFFWKRRLDRGAQLFVVKGNEHLPRFHAIALANEQLVDAPANFRAHASIAGFHRARTL